MTITIEDVHLPDGHRAIRRTTDHRCQRVVGGPAVHQIATFETDHQRTLSGGAHERPSADSVNGSDNEEESEHAISDSHDSRSVSPNAGDISVWAVRPTCKVVVRSSSGGGSCSLRAQDWAILLRHSSVGDWQTLGIDEHRWVVKRRREIRAHWGRVAVSDAKITQIYEGTNQVQRIVMARQLLEGLA